MKRALIGFSASIIVFGAVTVWALESGGVAIVETRAPDGTLRSTHVWYVQPEGELWLEAGSPGNSWFRDVQESPTLALEAQGISGSYIAEPIEDASGHSRIRSLIREKYGFRDLWINLIVSTSESIAVRLVPDPGGRP